METGGKKIGTLKFTVEVYENGPPEIWLSRHLDGAREHVPLPKPLLKAMQAYALAVVKR